MDWILPAKETIYTKSPESLMKNVWNIEVLFHQMKAGKVWSSFKVYHRANVWNKHDKACKETTDQTPGAQAGKGRQGPSL